MKKYIFLNVFLEILSKEKTFLLVAIILFIFSMLLFSITFIIIEKHKHNFLLIEYKKRMQFLSTMSHEIRTPLNAISGLSKLAILSKDSSQYLEKIQNATNYLSEMVNSILDLTKFEEGKIKLLNEACSLKEITDFLNTMLSQEAKKINIDFSITTNIQHEWVSTDEIRLKQVLINLISNAFKFTPPNGNVSLKIIEKNFTNSQGIYYFEVSDTGIGIPLNQQKRIFMPYEQIDTKTSYFQGTGLGLSISQKIINLMGSTISLHSVLQEGSTFSFELSLLFSEASSNTPSNFDTLKNKNILVVEDNPVNMEIVASFLEMKGINVFQATNGKEGIKEFLLSKENFFHLILMDIQMPVLDGIKASLEIRSLKRLDALKIPIIAMTANATMEHTISSGINDFISKPIQIENLFEIIQKHIL